eukprot:1582968-Alexandrium_andersonii.AAC.1
MDYKMGMFDIAYDDDMDMTGDYGFVHALSLVLRVRPGGRGSEKQQIQGGSSFGFRRRPTRGDIVPQCSVPPRQGKQPIRAGRKLDRLPLLLIAARVPRKEHHVLRGTAPQQHVKVPSSVCRSSTEDHLGVI